MSRRVWRYGILLFGLVTAVIHFPILSLKLSEFSLLFTLNALGYLVLLGSLVLSPPHAIRRQRVLHLVFILYTAVTITGFLVSGDTGFGGSPLDPLGWFTKGIEFLLILSLIGNYRQIK